MPNQTEVEALFKRLEKLGQDGVGNYGMPICAEAADELRRLYAENELLQEELAAEREACAKVCDGIGDGNKWSDAHDCAAAIRARNNT